MTTDQDNSNKGFTVVDRRFWVEDADGDPASDESTSPKKPSYVMTLEQTIEEKDRRLQDYINQHKQLASEFEDAKERIKREVGKETERTRRHVIRNFLDVLDNLNRAIASVDPKSPPSFAEGVVMVRDQFLGKLADLGVRAIPAEGTAFDPAQHEALTVVPVDDPALEGQVMQVLRDGFTIDGDILRPAGVAVAQKS
ncbi:MAG: nucleotide exchange factor GrpE [Myxococcota bacterium]|nr:nucleotide exchange factor GrpE [Myxococcota bacterium]